MTHRREAALGLGVIVAMVLGLAWFVVLHFPTSTTESAVRPSATESVVRPSATESAVRPSATESAVRPSATESVEAGEYTLQFTADALHSLRPVRFALRPSRPVKRVTIAGGFNGWNMTVTPLERTGQDWHITLWLPQGKHTFKYVYNGEEWALDPRYPAVTDGAGHTNSVVTVTARADLPFLIQGLAGAPGKHILVDVGSQREWLESTVASDGMTVQRTEILSGNPERHWGSWTTR